MVKLANLNLKSKYWSKSMDSKYCYPDSNVLINKFDVREIDKFDQLERIFTSYRLGELELKPVAFSFDLKHLQTIHHRIFKDLFDWAGKLREVDIAKENSFFAPSIQIESYSQEIFRQLKNERYLKGLDFNDFCERAAHYLGEINALHPFREGNGRTQREFIRNLAENNEFSLSWANVDRTEFIKASQESFLKGDNHRFKKIIEQSIEN